MGVATSESSCCISSDSSLLAELEQLSHVVIPLSFWLSVALYNGSVISSSVDRMSYEYDSRVFFAKSVENG